MALSLKPRQLLQHTLYASSRCYCDNSGKSIYQRDEEGPKERKVYGELYPEWRKPWLERKGEYRSKLSLFSRKNPNPDILNAMQNLPHLTMDKIKLWVKDMKDIQIIENQKFLAERTKTLGPNLAAAHFFTFRSASIRFKGQKQWLSGIDDEMNLPSTYQDGYYVEAIDCQNFHKGGLQYEGILNLSDLKFLKWLSLKNNHFIDAWCLDRIAGLTRAIEFLDISGCQLSIGSIVALSKMPELKMLVVTDPSDDLPLQAGLSLLEQERPGLIINAI